MTGDGVRMIPISTPKGDFRVWTRQVGDNPRIKLLLLHDGPGATHEYFAACDDYLPAAGIEFYYYDQLGSADQAAWFGGLIDFIRRVDAESAAPANGR